jgi:signal transduction histidine kinase
MTGALGTPRLWRWLPVVVLPPVLLLDGVLSERGDDVDALSVVLAYVAALPLVLLDRLGFLAMAPLIVAGVVLVLWDFEPGTTVVAMPAWALFELARMQGRRETVVAAVAVAPCVLVSVLPFADGGGEVVSLTLRNLALCELALAAGHLAWRGRAELERELAAREAEAGRRLGEERLRIAREVHDVVAHAMVAINVQAGVAAHLLDRDAAQAREALLHIRRTSGDALTDLRATLGVLREPHQEAPVEPAAGLGDLEALAARLRAAGVEVVLDVDAEALAAVPAPVHAAGHRIVQEALTNVLRHARAQAARVVVRAGEEALTIVVADDGRGGHTATGGSGAGVRGMRERAEALGGELDIVSQPGAGTTVTVRLP